MSENRNTKTTNTGAKRRISSVLTSTLLLVVIISLMFVNTGCSKKFDYLEADLSEYLEIPENYKNFKVEIDIAKPHDIDVDVAILNMLYADRDTEMKYGGTVTSPIEITAGDVVLIWYRGYILDDDGNEIAVTGMSNFGKGAADSLAIGSNNFIPGFELNLVGKNTGDYSKFVKITSGNVKENQIAYVTYTKVKNGDDQTKVTESNVRLDFSKDLDAVYGAGFEEKVIGHLIGGKSEITTTLDGDTYTYRDFKVNFVTECETNPIVVETYFPYDYNREDLRNETAYFEVYVEGVQVYDTPEFTDEYLKKKIEDKEINVTLDELNEYEGATLTEKYRLFAKDKMVELYESEYKIKVEEAVWAHFAEIFKATKYPEDKVKAIYDDYVDDISEAFVSYGGQLYDSTSGQYKTYDTLDAFAKVYVGATKDKTWQDIVMGESEKFVKERLVLFYVMKAEGLTPTAEEYQAEYDRLYKEYLDEAIEQFFSYAGKDRDDYTDEEYEEIVEECKDILDSTFDDDYFFVLPYSNILAKTIITWPEVSTLDDRRAYPIDK